ncbi:hypothetical protein ACOMHN_046996 [Nucella lapillus]
MLQDMKVNWTTVPGHTSKVDTSKHFHVFVGDLSPDLEQQHLLDAFASCGDISECKIIRDPTTHRSKGYGFVSFINKQDAEQAIQSMNGQWLGSRPIRTNWATRRPLTQLTKDGVKQLSYDEVHSQSSDSNCTVYCGGITIGLSEELMRSTFEKFGTIHEVRIFKEKGFAFVRFGSKESATKAICSVHGTVVSDQAVKCSWGKESNDFAPPHTPALVSWLACWQQGPCQRARSTADCIQEEGEEEGGGGEGGTYYRLPAYPTPATYATPLAPTPTPAPQHILPAALPGGGLGGWSPSTPPAYQQYGSVAAGSVGGVQWPQPVSPLIPQSASHQPTILTYPLHTGYLG